MFLHVALSVELKVNLFLIYSTPVPFLEFWIEAALMIFSAFNTLTPITEEMVLFLNCTTELQHINCAVKVICLTGKFHIHKARITQSKLTSIYFVSTYNISLHLSPK